MRLTFKAAAFSTLMACCLLAAPVAQAATPLVIAHRGASGYLPEHTLAGYELAVKLGADYIEPDLQFTRDGVLVAMHDDTLQRTTDVASLFATRNGGYRVSDFTLAEIKTLTVKPTGTGSTSYPGFTPANPALRVPTFQEVIDLAKSQSLLTGHTIGIYPEAKQADPLMEDKILAALSANGYHSAADKVFIQSFSDATIRSIDTKQSAQGLDMPLIVLGVGITLSDGTARMGIINGSAISTLSFEEVASFADGIGVVINTAGYTLTKSFIDQAHAAGLLVHGWTFAQADPALAAADYRKFLEMGMDGMFTNYADSAVLARDLFVSSIPEPSTWALLIAGLCGVAVVGSRRHSGQAHASIVH